MKPLLFKQPSIIKFVEENIDSLSISSMAKSLNVSEQTIINVIDDNNLEKTSRVVCSKPVEGVRYLDEPHYIERDIFNRIRDSADANNETLLKALFSLAEGDVDLMAEFIYIYEKLYPSDNNIFYNPLNK